MKSPLDVKFTPIHLSFWHKNMFYIGIILEKEAFKVAILKKEKQSFVTATLQTFSLGPDNVKLFYNLPPFHTGKQVQIVSGLSGTETFIRRLHLPLKERRKILATLPFQLETLVPFPTDNAIICTLLKPMSKQMTSVTIIASSQEYLSTHLSSLKELDISPDNVSCFSNALARFAKWQFPQLNRILVFHFQEDKIFCVLVEEGQLALSQTILFQEKNTIAFEIDKLLIFLRQKGAADETTPWLLTGNLEHSEIIQSIFSGTQLQLSDSALGLYAIPIGLSIDGLKSDASSVQFRQKEFVPEHAQRRRAKKMRTYLAACFTAALLMSFGGSLLIGKKQRSLTEALQNYLPASLAKGPLSSPDDFQNKLFEWEKSLNRQKNPFAFLPNVPKVSDVLAWISVHPAFATEEGSKKEGMEIKSLHYRLSKYPKIGEASNPYLAQVELEFTSSMPRAARDFHEALLKGDQIVNGKKEVKWQVQNQTYHTAFELSRGLAP